MAPRAIGGRCKCRFCTAAAPRGRADNAAFHGNLAGSFHCLAHRGSPAWADVHPVAPALSSLPGAPYTVYLDFTGFNFNGTWSGSAPGSTPAYNSDLDPTTFNTSEILAIQNMWNRVAEDYAPYNVNVTTVDPAVAAGQAGTDASRQEYYDNTAQMCHTVIGGTGAWYGDYHGVSHLGLTAQAQPFSGGGHTYWVFANKFPIDLQRIADSTAHEIGHGFDLLHQSDFDGNTLVNEYSSGTSSLGPIMGVAYNSARGAWKVGTADYFSPVTQNDAQIIANNQNLGGFREDGIGHSPQTATPLPLSGAAINAAQARGIIVPANSAQPLPSGIDNYVAAFWSFTTGAGSVTISSIAGRQAALQFRPARSDARHYAGDS